MTAIYRDPATYELLFMECRNDGRWIPCLDAMESWRTAAWRLYQTGPADFVTMPDGDRWPLLPAAEEANIEHVLVHPWIPDGSAMDVTEGDLTTTDLLIQLAATEDEHDHVWDLMDTVVRPTLVWDDSFLQRASEPLSLPPAAAAAATGAGLPKHIADLVLRDAEARGAICPISMEPIKAADASVTSCGHVFQAAAIRNWLTAGHNTCPECRTPQK
jgi:hypothetical protein